ncbi:hypothetical protein [Streptomyces vastus]|uniref:Sugar ABC transporter substrate-binding protein n=1 Tax=Streptomyces vastus TaxID=285451 RepID=A0ABP6D0A6_9ACTN
MERTQTRRPSGRRLSRSGRVVVSLFTAAATALTGCASGKASGGDGDQSTAPAGGGSTSGKSNGKNSIYVIGGKADDPFWSAIKRGGEDAGKLVKGGGGKVTFLGPHGRRGGHGPPGGRARTTAGRRLTD